MSEDTGYGVAAAIVVLSLLVVIYFDVITFSEIYKSDLIKTSVNNDILNLTIITLIFYTFSCVGGLSEPLCRISANSEGIDVSATLSLLFYALGKWTTYILFTSRLKYVFKDLRLRYSNGVLNFIYTVLGIQFLFLVAWVVGSSHNQFKPSAATWDNDLNVGGGIIFYLIDIFLSILLPYLFIRKLYQLIPASMSNDLELQINNNDKAESEPAEPPSSQQNIPSVTAIGVTSSDMPISNNKDNNGDANQHKYNQILNTVARITLLTTCVCISTTVIIVVGSVLESGSSAGAISIAQSLFKVDSAVNTACISLCYTWNDRIYNYLCGGCHEYYKNKHCCSCCCPKSA